MSGPPQVVARARLAVKAALTERIERLADATAASSMRPAVLAGVSGGADSLALAATMQWVASRMGLETIAAIIDHGLQDNSAAVAERAALQCERLGIRTVITRVDVKETAGGLEQAARAARYEALEQIAENERCLALALGHTLDDHAEQVLLGLARGAGARSLAGIPRSRGMIIRPFLGTGREETTGLWRRETREICTLLDVDVWDDPMNTNEDFLRVAARTRAIPALEAALGPHVKRNLVRTADLLADDAEFLDSLAREEAQGLRRDCPDGALLAFDAYALAALPRAVRTRIIKNAATWAEQQNGEPSAKTLLRRHVLQIDALLSAYRGQGPVLLPGKIVAERAEGLLVFAPGLPGRPSFDNPFERTAREHSPRR